MLIPSGVQLCTFVMPALLTLGGGAEGPSQLFWDTLELMSVNRAETEGSSTSTLWRAMALPYTNIFPVLGLQHTTFDVSCILDWQGPKVSYIFD